MSATSCDSTCRKLKTLVCRNSDVFLNESGSQCHLLVSPGEIYLLRIFLHLQDRVQMKSSNLGKLSRILVYSACKAG